MVTKVLKQKTPHQIRESRIEAELIKRVLANGGLHRKMRWISRRHSPDQFIALCGHVYLVEVKRPGEKPRPGQSREHARLRAQGVRVEVVSTMDEVEKFINKVRERM